MGNRKEIGEPEEEIEMVSESYNILLENLSGVYNTGINDVRKQG